MSLCQNLVDIIEGNISQKANKILGYCEYCKSKSNLVIEKYINYCRGCKKSVCNLCIEKTKKRCILCVNIENKLCEICGWKYILMMCYECGDLIKVCQLTCQGSDFPFLTGNKAYCQNCSDMGEISWKCGTLS